MAQKRMMWLDIAKGLAILLMVLGHCLDASTPLHDFIYSFHMPLFFLAAGFTMRAKPRRDVLASSARRLLVPYFVVSAILFAFAFVSPHSLDPDLDTQRAWPVVLVEISYAAGDKGDLFGHHFQAIGALWFLPCLFVARLILNEILLRGAKLNGRPALQLAVEAAGVAAATALGIALGAHDRLPFDIDTALVVTSFMFVGVLAKRYDLIHAPWFFWVLAAFVWFGYTVYGSGDIAERAYLDQPITLLTATAGSLVVMKGCLLFEQAADRLRLSALNRGLAWCGIVSLYILCVHRVESAVFNWQKIMQFFCPGVWNWDLTLQGLYWFGLRIMLVLACTYVLNRLIKRGSALWRERRVNPPSTPAGLQRAA